MLNMITDFERLVGQILTQHKMFFPKATISTQMEKLSEEMLELSKATSILDREDEGGSVLNCVLGNQI